ncbi:2-phospho-L-lactate guanylyltransferase [Cellulomonas endophytica]|uniref:2-phospho-L-lactate guanylyltransferase n=1 Tax=Cellulomonas endophytica TaxID=2494735 RepID=UPI001F0C4BE0|nr:2-phospho-L-lactate guanylyltransferase [Cellulomonas endophytica]
MRPVPSRPVTGWSVVVPVRGAATGKSRLLPDADPADRAALVRAIALDTVAAAAAAPGVAAVLVVTPDEGLREDLAGPGTRPGAPVEVVAEPPAATTGGAQGPEPGLDAAVAAGVAAARVERPDAPVAVLLGDLPALDPADLGEALAAAAGVARGLVADADGTGTTLLTLAAHEILRTRFGRGSAAVHGALGSVALAVPSTSSLRRDVDVREDLEAVLAAPGGNGRAPRTRAAWARALDGARRSA